MEGALGQREATVGRLEIPVEPLRDILRRPVKEVEPVP